MKMISRTNQLNETILFYLLPTKYLHKKISIIFQNELDTFAMRSNLADSRGKKKNFLEPMSLLEQSYILLVGKYSPRLPLMHAGGIILQIKMNVQITFRYIYRKPNNIMNLFWENFTESSWKMNNN